MFGDGSLTFREFITHEPHPLAVIHDAVLEFLRGREDAVLCGAHAVNAYIDEPRMTQDVDLLSFRADGLAAELQGWLSDRFDIRIAMKTAGNGSEFRLCQKRRTKRRHLVDVRWMNPMPPFRIVEEVRVLPPAELIGAKLICMVGRSKTPKAGTDMADLFRLLLTFPELKTEKGSVAKGLRASGVSPKVMAAWKDLVSQEILPEDEDAGY